MNYYHSEDASKKQKKKNSAVELLSKFVWNIIWSKYRTYAEHYSEELYNQGVIGILEGLKNYDPDKGAPTTHFYKTIKGSLSKFSNEYVNGATGHYVRNLNKINIVIAQFEEQGIPYNAESIAAATNIPLDTVTSCLLLKGTTTGRISFDSEEYTSALGSQQISQSAEDAYLSEAVNEILVDALSQIDETVATMIKLTIPGWYTPDEQMKILGFVPRGDKATKKELAKAFKMSESEVTMRIRKGMTALKKILNPVRKPDKVLNKTNIVFKPKSVNLDDLDIL